MNGATEDFEKLLVCIVEIHLLTRTFTYCFTFAYLWTQPWQQLWWFSKEWR